MTELEKLNTRLSVVSQAISDVMHAASVERKMSTEKHHTGHYMKALTELTNLRHHIESQIRRHDVQ